MRRGIPNNESLTVEFKSDRKKLPDRDLVAAVVCLANSEGVKFIFELKKMAPSPDCIRNIKV